MTDLTKIRNDILREMYSEAEPPLEFDKVLGNESKYPYNWTLYHYLPAHRQYEIFDKHIENADITTDEEVRLEIHCLTRKGPTSSKHVRNRARKQATIE